jgi:hypothetical protein
MVPALVLAVALSAASNEAEQLFAKAEQEEHDLAFGAALADYDASIATEPSNRYALRAAARSRWLRARAEGSFVPLERLERVRRDPSAQHDASTVDALAHDLETFPVGEVRTEARMFVAEAYTSLHRTPDAERELDALLDDPAGAAPIRAQAAIRLADIAMARGDVAAAKHAADRVASIDAPLVTQVAHWARRRVIERVAIGVIALFVIGSAVATAKRARRLGELGTFAPRAFALCAYLGLVAGLLANAFERGNALPFLVLAALVLPVALLARAWALAGASTLVARALRATLGAVTVVAIAFLVLDKIDVRYLESFGL